nr:hypothetical protein CFP56_56959 [Quercus suber]
MVMPEAGTMIGARTVFLRQNLLRVHHRPVPGSQLYCTSIQSPPLTATLTHRTDRGDRLWPVARPLAPDRQLRCRILSAAAQHSDSDHMSAALPSSSLDDVSVRKEKPLFRAHCRLPRPLSIAAVISARRRVHKQPVRYSMQYERRQVILIRRSAR